MDNDEGKLFFEIPDDPNIMAKIIEAVPPEWGWISGSLRCPASLIEAEKVALGTCFRLSRFHSISPTIIPNRNGETPDLFGIMVEQKSPEFVVFECAGYSHDNITLELAKRIAMGFVHKGFRGGIRFYLECYDNKEFDNPARCDIELEPWRSHPGDEEVEGSDLHFARVKLVWTRKYGGTREMIEPIEKVCRELGLTEYTPKPPFLF